MRSQDLAQLAATAGLLALLTLRWRQLRTPGPQRDLLVCFYALALTAFIDILPIYRLIERDTPTGTPAAIRDLIVFVATASLANFVAAVRAQRNGSQSPVADTKGIRRLHNAAAAGLGLISILPWLVSSPGAADAALRTIPDWFDTTWRTPVHVLPLALAASYALTLGVWSALTDARDYSGPMKMALRTLAIGAALSAPFIVLKVTTVAFWLSNRGPETIDRIATVESVSQALSLVTIAAGGTCVLVLQRRKNRATDSLLPKIMPLWELLSAHEQHRAARHAVRQPAPGHYDAGVYLTGINDFFLDLTPYGRNDVRAAALLQALEAGHDEGAALDLADAAWLDDALRARETQERQVEFSDAPYCSADPHAAAVRLGGLAAAWAELRAADPIRAHSR